MFSPLKHHVDVLECVSSRKIGIVNEVLARSAPNFMQEAHSLVDLKVQLWTDWVQIRMKTPREEVEQPYSANVPCMLLLLLYMSWAAYVTRSWKIIGLHLCSQISKCSTTELISLLPCVWRHSPYKVHWLRTRGKRMTEVLFCFASYVGVAGIMWIESGCPTHSGMKWTCNQEQLVLETRYWTSQLSGGGLGENYVFNAGAMPQFGMETLHMSQLLNYIG